MCEPRPPPTARVDGYRPGSRSAADRSKLRRNICALANDLPGHGQPRVILIGVEDDGECSNATIDDRLLSQLAGMKDDGNIMPIPSLVVEKHVQKHILSGCEVAAILVEPSQSTPVRYQGRVWVRVGPTVRLATPEEEQRLSERRRAGERPFLRIDGVEVTDPIRVASAPVGRALEAEHLGPHGGRDGLPRGALA